jgi:hypothetical protein
VLAAQVSGSSITTIEGLAQPDGTMHPMQAAFKDCHGLQCGFCTPGRVLSAVDLCQRHPGAVESEIREQLERKHPQVRRDWDGSGVEDMPRLVLGGARDVFKDLQRNSGVGADRLRAEYLIRIVRGGMDEAARENVLAQWTTCAERVVNMDLPGWFYLVWTTVVQFAPIKQMGATPAHHEVRPVGCGGIARRAIARMVKSAKKEDLRRKCEPVQLGQGTSGGVQAVGLGMQIHMEAFDDTFWLSGTLSTPSTSSSEPRSWSTSGRTPSITICSVALSPSSALGPTFLPW